MQSIIFLLFSNTQSFPTTRFPTTSLPITSIPTNFTTVTTTMATTSPKTVTVAPLQNDLPQKELQRGGTVVYDDDKNYDQYYFDDDQRKKCKNDEYEIHIVMSDDPWSGTDDNVFIRLYSNEKESTEWYMLDTPGILNNDFERLSYEMYCLPSNVHSGVQPTKIGILKSGTDDMKIDDIKIWDGQNCFGVDIENGQEFSRKWMKNKEENYFNVDFCENIF